MEKLPKYLVRPHDFHIWEIDEFNNCYRSYSNRTVTYSDGTRPNAQKHFTYENLTENYDFFPIDEDEIEIYQKKGNFYHKYINWITRSDGHGGSKGGTLEEYIKIFGEE